MKIVYHHRTRGEDAQGVHIKALVDSFRELGHSVLVVAPLNRRSNSAPAAESPPPPKQSGGDQVDGDARPTLKGVPIPFWLYEVLALAYNIPATAILLYVVLRHRPAFIYERYSLYNLAGLWVSRITGRPLVLEINAPLSLELQTHGGLVFRRLAQSIEDSLCRRAHRTIVVTRAMAEIFTARGIPEQRLMVIPNGVNGNDFNPNVDGTLVREHFGVEHCRVIGFVGWIRPWHGVDGLIEAFDALEPRKNDIRLLIVGDGPAVPALRRVVDERGLAPFVIFTGRVERQAIPEHIAALDIAVQPDVTDYASPIKLFEYLAIGRAVVAPDKPNIREVVSEGQSALLFPPRDWKALKDRLHELLQDSEMRLALGRQASARAEAQGYTWQGNARRVIGLIESDPSASRAPEA